MDNDVILLGLCTITVCLITGFCIKYYFVTTEIETPNSPPTFNFTTNQLREIEIQAENTIIDQDFIKSGESCYPEKYPMISADDPTPVYNKFDLDFLAKDFTGDLIEKMEKLYINCPFEGYELFSNFQYIADGSYICPFLISFLNIFICNIFRLIGHDSLWIRFIRVLSIIIIKIIIIINLNNILNILWQWL